MPKLVLNGVAPHKTDSLVSCPFYAGQLHKDFGVLVHDNIEKTNASTKTIHFINIFSKLIYFYSLYVY